MSVLRLTVKGETHDAMMAEAVAAATAYFGDPDAFRLLTFEAEEGDAVRTNGGYAVVRSFEARAVFQSTGQGRRPPDNPGGGSR